MVNGQFAHLRWRCIPSEATGPPPKSYLWNSTSSAPPPNPGGPNALLAPFQDPLLPRRAGSSCSHPPQVWQQINPVQGRARTSAKWLIIIEYPVTSGGMLSSQGTWVEGFWLLKTLVLGYENIWLDANYIHPQFGFILWWSYWVLFKITICSLR